ncbi:hypothetical protein FJU30_23895 [Affinibrenneria salicis]|uniref:Uncharacterized protein n=1 Tax=Affinibrenneria salicis TaxID=2590031 RepID=A0A5J5FR59_9GAMM|nr:hypothetical protein [Affinibrenneria salicis]KAA8995607.1 hypothetical protein FJU30_23895 [Affinibrenneria salicis]
MLEQIKDEILARGDYAVKIHKNDFTQSLVVDIENESDIARFTLWDDGSCMMEIIDVASGQYILDERRTLLDMAEIIACFNMFIAVLAED